MFVNEKFHLRNVAFVLDGFDNTIFNNETNIIGPCKKDIEKKKKNLTPRATFFLQQNY